MKTFNTITTIVNVGQQTRSPSMVARIRHTHPLLGYNLKTRFFHDWTFGREGRKKLNATIVDMLTGSVSLDRFQTLAMEIDRGINLNIRANQKRFIEQRIAEYQKEYPDLSHSRCKVFAFEDLHQTLVSQEKHNARQKKKQKVYFN